MKNKNRHIRILLLMITSQLLLTLFIVQWLRSQYDIEKERLTGELTGYYLAAQDELIDTTLFRSYVRPVLSHDRINASAQIITINDSLPPDSITGQGRPGRTGKEINWQGAKGTIMLSVNQEGDSAQRLPDTIKLRRTNEDLLLRSVRMIVSHSSDSSNEAAPATFEFNLNLDTLLFKEHFAGKLSGKGMSFSIAWDNEINNINKKDRKRIYLSTITPFHLPEAAVTRFSGYLFSMIFPQVLFGLVLTLITALAFFLSYRNIRDQMVLNSLRNEFISNITHELKTPVSTISVALESLGKFNMRDDPSHVEEYLRLASLEAKRLGELINRILDQSLLEENSHPLNMVKTDLVPIIREVIGMMKPRLINGGSIEFITEQDGMIISGDPLFLKGVIVNLVDNSIRYCDKTPEISILVTREAGHIVIKVNDNGPGIPQEFHKKIFEKFFRLPSGNVHNVKGYGLGLSFVSLVMKLHNGSAEVRNLNPGCSFILKIPSAG